jgi:hypothetical protein
MTAIMMGGSSFTQLFLAPVKTGYRDERAVFNCHS